MKLVAYPVEGHSIDIRPAPATREWMDATKNAFAYRCLPLNIANAHGWEVLCPVSFAALWSGGQEPGAVGVTLQGETLNPPYGHFGHGILTFDINCVFRTEPGYDLLVQGPANRPKDGIAALSGIIETDWAPYTFTMNWQFTRPGHSVTFAKGEPICSFFPVARSSLESVTPVLGAIGEDPELARAFADWKSKRDRFVVERKDPSSTAAAEKWQKDYFRGLKPDGESRGTDDHRTRVRLKPFARGSRPDASE
jgi:hypothetical protein